MLFLSFYERSHYGLPCGEAWVANDRGTFLASSQEGTKATCPAGAKESASDLRRRSFPD